MSLRSAAVWVIGGANADIKARSAATFVAGTSNPGSVHYAFGGVARNVAENLGRLGWRPLLVSAIGVDGEGETLLAHAIAAGIDIRYVDRVEGAPTGRYIALLADDGELIGAVADMAALEQADRPLAALRDMRSGDVAMIDANLRASTFSFLLSACREQGVTTFVEPVSVSKSKRVVGSMPYIDVLTPNVDELAALLGEGSNTPLAKWMELEPLQARTVIENSAARLCQRGCATVIVTCGATGACLVARDEKPQWFPAQKTNVQDVTGAGDALTAGVLHGFLEGLSLAAAMPYGMALAGLTVGHEGAVVSTLSRKLLEAQRVQYLAAAFPEEE